MPEEFPYNKIEDLPEVPRKTETEADSSKIEEFFGRESEILGAYGMTSSGQAVKETYKPDAEVIEDIRQLPKAMQNIILKYVSDL